MRQFVERTCCFLIVLALGQLGAGAAARGDETIPRDHHAWGRFEPGSWKLVRVVTETFDAEGKLVGTSKTETRTTLYRVNDEGVTLKVESTHEVAGKKFESQPEFIEQKFAGGEETRVQKLGSGEVTIEGRTFPCTIQQLETTSGSTKTVTKTYYSEQVAPYVLRTETLSQPTQGEQARSETTVEVFALNMPYKVLSELKSTSHIRAVHQHQQGTTRTLLVTAMDVPGGVVSHTSKEVDNQGRLTRRSTLELLDYHAIHKEPEVRQRAGRRGIGIFRRFRRR